MDEEVDATDIGFLVVESELGYWSGSGWCSGWRDAEKYSPHTLDWQTGMRAATEHTPLPCWTHYITTHLIQAALKSVSA